MEINLLGFFIEHMALLHQLFKEIKYSNWWNIIYLCTEKEYFINIEFDYKY